MLCSLVVDHTGKYGSFDEISCLQASFDCICTCAVTTETLNCMSVCVCVCTEICIPPTVTPLGDNDHTHACGHLPSLCESALQSRNLACAAAMLSSLDCGVGCYNIPWNSQ